MDETMEFEVITIPTLDGTEKDFAIMDQFDVEDKTYVVVSEVEGDEILDGFYLYEYAEDADGIVVSSIDDEEEFERIANVYYEICEEDTDEQ